MKFIADHDYHIHSNISFCAADDKELTKERILKYAIDNNFTEICITDHLWDSDVPGASAWYQGQNYEHIAAVLPLPKIDGVSFSFGCETELDKFMTVGLAKEKMENFDFIIIPTTHLHMNGFTVDESKTSVEDRAGVWIDRLDKLLDMELPWHKIGIAHLTCSLIAYNRGDFDEHIRILDTVSDDTYVRLFEKLRDKGAGFELNFVIERYNDEQLARALRPYRIAKEVGCKFYLGSDSHSVKELEAAKKRFEKIVDALDLKETDRFRFGK